jgi:peptide subunit release factor RF-3
LDCFVQIAPQKPKDLKHDGRSKREKMSGFVLKSMPRDPKHRDRLLIKIDLELL